MQTSVLIRKRIAVLFLLLAAAIFLLFLRVAWLQLVKGDELQKLAENNRERSLTIDAKRGIIYDRNMKELAISVSTDSIYAVPAEVKRSGKQAEVARQLARILEISEEKILKALDRDSSFSWIQRKVDYEKARKIKALNLPGIDSVEEYKRYFPKDTLAAHVLGFTGADRAWSGLEMQYENELKGTSGTLETEYDAQGRAIYPAERRYVAPKDGLSLVTTIDETIQYIVERELDRLVASPTNPKSATIIVMEPATGEVLAMASRPTFDPNHYQDYSQESWRNPAVLDSYEPGSTFKIVTTSASLEEAVVRPNDRFYDPGFIKVGSETIKCWRFPRAHGSQTFVEGVENSCNPVFVEIGLRLEDKAQGLFYKYIRAFNFGKKTGIDFPAEATGIMIGENNLKKINIATISIGQGIAVTPIQLISAVSAVANGGTWIRPHLVKAFLGNDGQVVRKVEPQAVTQVISEETAQQVRTILEGVVSRGTGVNAYIPGYRAAGKTGTAQKVGKGGYEAGKYVASFVGFAPANDPRLAILVVIDEPKGYPYYGGTIAAPIFARVMADSLRYLGVPPQFDPEREKEQIEARERKVIVPHVVDLTVEQARKALLVAGLEPDIQGSGDIIVNQTPKGSVKVVPGTRVIIYAGAAPSRSDGLVVVPEVTGKRIREAADLLEAFGLIMQPEGQGEALRQEPVPGSRVLPGTPVKVIFEENAVQQTMGP
ncbi:MAG: stage V sporulation protein D [Bacillota bacterium]